MLQVVAGHSIITTESGDVGPYRHITTTVECLDRCLASRKVWRSVDLKTEGNFLEEGGKGRRLMLTFDDGYHDNLVNLLPLLEHYDMSCVIFVTTGFICGELIPYEIALAEIINQRLQIIIPDGQSIATKSHDEKEACYGRLRLQLQRVSRKRRNRYMIQLMEKNGISQDVGCFNARFLTWGEVKMLDKHPLVTIGAHTHTHISLPATSSYTAFREMRTSKRLIENRLGHRINLMSYPYGAHSWRIRRLARLAGFRYAFSSEQKLVYADDSTDPLAIPRFDLNSWCTSFL